MQETTLIVPRGLTVTGVRVFMRWALDVAIESRAELLVLDLAGWDASAWFVEACEKMVVVLGHLDCGLRVDGVELADLPVMVG